MHKEKVLQQKMLYPDIDRSYYLTGDEAGQLNAFEEYFVLTLTDVVLTKNPPIDLTSFLEEILYSSIAKTSFISPHIFL